MIRQTLTGRRVGLSAALFSVVVLAVGMVSHLAAQGAGNPASTQDDGTAQKPNKRHVVRKPAETGTAPASQAKATDPVDFAAQLDKAGAAGCRKQVNALATSTMGSVVQYNTVSNWALVGGGKRAVSVAIGQKYASGSVVPYSVSQIIAMPNQQGSCDGFAVQVLPSPLSCDKLRETITKRGKQIGDLAGISLMQDNNGRTMLVPTAANTCVLVATRTDYAN